MNEKYKCTRCETTVFAEFELNCKCGNWSECGKDSVSFCKVVEKGVDWGVFFFGFLVGNTFCGICIWILNSAQ